LRAEKCAGRSTTIELHKRLAEKDLRRQTAIEGHPEDPPDGLVFTGITLAAYWQYYIVCYIGGFVENDSGVGRVREFGGIAGRHCVRANPAGA
jgi:hypothetical protein